MIPNKRFIDGMHPEQTRFFESFDSGYYRYYWLNWHRRARKTTACLNLLIRECCRFPNTISDYIAPTYKQAKMIIWRDPNMLAAYLPSKAEMEWVKNESELYVRFGNGSLLNIKGADNPDSLRGANAHRVAFDEWALINPVVWEEMYRPIIYQEKNRWAAFLFTPKGQNHAYTGYNNAVIDPQSFATTLSAEKSGIIPADELEKARREMTPAFFAQEFLCSFVAEEECTLITSASLERLKSVSFNERRVKKLIAVDPATGGDECVAKVFENTHEIGQHVYRHRDEMKVVAELQLLAIRYGINNFVLDEIGLGAGIGSRMRQLGYHVISQKSSESAIDSDIFANQKAEMWWKVAGKVRDCQVAYPEDEETRRQLSAVQYKIQNGSGKVLIVPKTETKKILGCSPDRADTWVMGQYYLDFIDSVGENGKIKRPSMVPDYVRCGVA